MKKHEILKAAYQIAVEVGFNRMTRENIAEAAGCSEALVSHYFGDMEDLRCTILTSQLAARYPAVVLQGIALRHPSTEDMSNADKLEVFTSFLEE